MGLEQREAVRPWGAWPPSTKMAPHPCLSSRSVQPPAAVVSSGVWSGASTRTRGCPRRTVSSAATRPGPRTPGRAAPRTASLPSPPVSAHTPQSTGEMGSHRTVALQHC